MNNDDNNDDNKNNNVNINNKWKAQITGRGHYGTNDTLYQKVVMINAGNPNPKYQLEIKSLENHPI